MWQRVQWGSSAAVEVTPTVVGSYFATGRYPGDANFDPAESTCTLVAVADPADPAITTQVSDATAAPGQAFTDTATLTRPAHLPAPTGTVTFDLFGPDDDECTEDPVFTSLRDINGSSVESAPYTTSVEGIYRWVAEYSGDATYRPDSGRCNDPDETVKVSLLTDRPPVDERYKPNLELIPHEARPGVNPSITARLTGVRGQPEPTGAMLFEVYFLGPTQNRGAGTFTREDASAERSMVVAEADQSACSTEVHDSTVPIEPGRPTESEPFTPRKAGTYQWIASYSGDDFYEPTATDCSTSSGTFTVTELDGDGDGDGDGEGDGDGDGDEDSDDDHGALPDTGAPAHSILLVGLAMVAAGAAALNAVRFTRS